MKRLYVNHIPIIEGIEDLAQVEEVPKDEGSDYAEATAFCWFNVAIVQTDAEPLTVRVSLHPCEDGDQGEVFHLYPDRPDVEPVSIVTELASMPDNLAARAAVYAWQHQSAA